MNSELEAGQFIIVESYVKLNPITFTEIFDDRLLKKYVTALIKRQWGANLAKYDGVQLPGGVSLRGGEIMREAQEEIDRIEVEVRSEYELPVDFFAG
jgi:hypothetical protein